MRGSYKSSASSFFLVISLVWSLSWPALGGRRGYHRRCVDEVNTQEFVQKKIDQIHQLKGTFEKLIPVHPDSFAAKFPDIYMEVMDLFMERPSHLVGANGGRPPDIGMPFGQIVRNMHKFGWDIGTDLGYILRKLPSDYYARPVFEGYVTLFQKDINKWSSRQDPFSAVNMRQVEEMAEYGKKIICSQWAELRVSMLVENISRANIRFRQLRDEGVIPNFPNSLSSFLDQEIDHLWFPKQNGEVSAVAIGETKVFDRPFSSKYASKDDVFEQYDRYLEVASRLGAHYGLPPEVHYFFVAGITPTQIENMQKKAEEFNHRLQGIPNHLRAPVRVFIHGNYNLAF